MQVEVWAANHSRPGLLQGLCQSAMAGGRGMQRRRVMLSDPCFRHVTICKTPQPTWFAKEASDGQRCDWQFMACTTYLLFLR